MKLGIITFHCAHNYGATLQAYGFQEYLKSLGHEVFMIDYRPEYITRCYQRDNNRDWLSRNPWMCVKRLINYIRYKDIRHSRWDAFNHFIDSKFNFYPYKKNDDFSSFDTIFIGSDQVWSPYHTGGSYDDVLFGVGFKCKVVSYAASCSQSSFTEEQNRYLRLHLDEMTGIGIREEKFKEMLKPLTNKEIQITVDPTILCGAETFRNIAIAPKRMKPYVLLYEIRHHEETFKIAQIIAKQLNADIVELVNGPSYKRMDIIDQSASPEEFLGYIAHAACVVTTSFHGTAFSLLFHRPIYAVRQNNDADIRLENLLESVGLLERFIHINDPLSFEDINYSDVEGLLDCQREESICFINQILNNQSK